MGIPNSIDNFPADNHGDDHEGDHGDDSTLPEMELSSGLREAPKLPKIIAFRDLCRCGDEVWIANEGLIYRLRRTKQGKLILTK